MPVPMMMVRRGRITRRYSGFGRYSLVHPNSQKTAAGDFIFYGLTTIRLPKFDFSIPYSSKTVGQRQKNRFRIYNLSRGLDRLPMPTDGFTSYGKRMVDCFTRSIIDDRSDSFICTSHRRLSPLGNAGGSFQTIHHTIPRRETNVSHGRVGNQDHFCSCGHETGTPYHSLINVYLQACARKERKSKMNGGGLLRRLPYY